MTNPCLDVCLAQQPRVQWLAHIHSCAHCRARVSPGATASCVCNVSPRARDVTAVRNVGGNEAQGVLQELRHLPSLEEEFHTSREYPGAQSDSRELQLRWGYVVYACSPLTNAVEASSEQLYHNLILVNQKMIS